MQELKPKPGDIRPKLLENMALLATKQKQNVEKALSAFMDLTVDEVVSKKIKIQTKELIAVIIHKFEQCGFYNRLMCPKDADRMSNNVDSDQTAQATDLSVPVLTVITILGEGAKMNWGCVLLFSSGGIIHI